VARIEDPLAGPLGTGFLVDGTAIHEGFPAIVLITNAHVVSEEAPQALAPDQALVTFRALEDASATYRIKRILWSSPPNELDTTIVELDARPQAALPSPVARRRPQMDVDPPPRTYIIGHPSGTDQVMLSVADNQLLDHDDVHVQYRTPTMGGSSGSPVYNRSWELIAVHHAGSMHMKRLGGHTGTYPANEGIW
jgi:V8-like Glu-specific endopeptidase